MSPATQPDVLIAGGGIIGCSLAWRLAQGGARVTICEMGRIGGESSWAGAGMLVPGSEFEEPGEWLDFALHSLSLYPDFVRELGEESGEVIEFGLCGSLELAADDEEWERLKARALRQQRWGIPSEPVDAATLRQRAKGLSRNMAGAVFYPGEGQVDPRTVTAALRTACRRRGVQVREGTRVATLYPHADGVDARLENGETVSASLAVIAAGAWSSLLGVPGRKLPESFPVKGHLVGYRLTVGSLPHVLRFRHTYVVQRSNGFTIAGASVEHVGFDRFVDVRVVEQLAGAAHALAGGLLPLVPDEAWIGFRPGVAGDLPVIGQFEDLPVWLAYGHYRNGILLAPATAERLGPVILGSLGR